MSATQETPQPQVRRRLRSLRMTRLRELFVFSGLNLSSLFSILITIVIVIVLVNETTLFFKQPEVSFQEFVTSDEWTPTLGSPPSYGIRPLICGTLLVTGIAMMVAVPLGLITAIYLSEYSPRWIRALLKPTLEILAGIPTIVYGFLALRLFTPILQGGHGFLFEGTEVKGFDGYNALSAGMAVGILCFPTVCSLAEDALRAVPNSLREGGYALGGTKFDVSTKIVFPSALSGVISAVLLAVARAVGETMIVAMAAGSIARLTLDPRDQIQTMTGHMVKMASSDLSYESPQYHSMYAVAIALFSMTLALTILGSIIRRRFREAYE